jgi:hypothetical protein
MVSRSLTKVPAASHGRGSRFILGYLVKLSSLLISITGAIALGLAASAAQAKTDSFVYTSISGAPNSATGTLTFHPVAAGVYAITGITGNVDGDTISPTAPVSNPDSPNAATSPDGLFIYDNDVYSHGPTLSNPGVLFDGASGAEYNLFSQGSEYVLYEALNGSYVANSVGNFTLTGGVLEPASWLMMVMGVAAVGAGLRMGRGRQLANA